MTEKTRTKQAMLLGQGWTPITPSLREVWECYCFCNPNECEQFIAHKQELKELLAELDVLNQDVESLIIDYITEDCFNLPQFDYNKYVITSTLYTPIKKQRITYQDRKGVARQLEF